MVPICDPTYPLNPPKLVNWPKIGSALATFFAGYLRLLPIQFPDFGCLGFDLRGHKTVSSHAKE